MKSSVLLILFLAAPLESADVTRPALLYTSAAALDLASTRYLSAHGGREAWLPAQSLTGQAALKLGAAAALTWGDVQVQKSGHKGWAKVARVVVCTIWGGAAVVNLRRAK